MGTGKSITFIGLLSALPLLEKRMENKMLTKNLEEDEAEFIKYLS